MGASVLTSRLRELVGVDPLRPVIERQALMSTRPLIQLADELGGEVCELEGGCCVMVDRWYTPDTTHGQQRIGAYAEMMRRHVNHVSVLGPSRGVPRLSDTATLRFFDLETTGLAGGAGTYAFLVGCGTFEDGSFHTRQFFLTTYAAERPLLGAVARYLANAELLVSFNGRTFDAPVLETRYLFHRLAVPFSGVAHLDMLHASRRLWGGDEGCSLKVLEEMLAGVVRHGDIPGADIPARYVHYARTGDARPLGPVFEHNRLDLLSLAVLTSVAVRLVDDGARGTRDGRECLGLGRLFERVGLDDRATACYAHVASHRAETCRDIRLEALRRLARRMRRDGRHRDAAAAWRQILGVGVDQHPAFREAVHALAVHHEHRLKDLPTARGLAIRAVVTAVSETDQAQARHRLARLDRKLSANVERADVLFEG